MTRFFSWAALTVSAALLQPYRLRQIALAVAFLTCGSLTLHALWQPNFLAPSRQMDFNVYYVAADLVQHGLDNHIYDDAGTGIDPQTRFADPASALAKTARQNGLERIQLYLYPPFLADVLVPLTYLSLPEAEIAWRFLNLFALLLTAACTGKLLDFRLSNVGSALVLLGLLSIRPIREGVFFGQVTLLLLLLWVVATLSYVENRKFLSAFLIAIAVLIKLTPLILLAPMLIWRDWRWVSWFLGSLATLITIVCLKNGPDTFLFFALHVMPSMSNGIPNLDNKTVLSAVQIVWHGRLDFTGVVIPHMVILFGKMLSAGIVVCAAALTISLGKDLPIEARIAVIAAFSLLSVCVAPVSWAHAYGLAFFMLAVMWKRAFDDQTSILALLLLLTTTLAICGISLTSVARDAGPPYLIAYSATGFGIALCIQSLSSRLSRRLAPKALVS